jgi:hypothetical protein
MRDDRANRPKGLAGVTTTRGSLSTFGWRWRIDTSRRWRDTAFVADELVEVFHLIAKGNGVGRVLGVRLGREGSYEAELLMIWRIGDDYRLRSAVVGLDALPSACGQLFKYPPPARLSCEDVEFSTLEETLTVAATLASQAAPLPGQGTWRMRSEFLETLLSALRPEMTSLPDPPHWWNVMRRVLVGTGNIALFAVPTGITWWLLNKLGAWDWDADLASGVGVVLWIALSLLVALLSDPGGRALDAVERRIQQHRSVTGAPARDASDADVLDGVSGVQDVPVDPISYEVHDSPTVQGD